MSLEASGKYVLTYTSMFVNDLDMLVIRYEEALELYTEMLKEHPTHSTVMKRKVAIHKAKGETTEAIRELNSLLEM